jgi:amino acid adenylation domain-containing protein/FkbM family methyltransferase
VGVAGELWIGGVGLARGYVNDPERTAGQFVWHAALQQRLYRTGDVAKRLADGNLEYMGRMDTQVKLRGYRIELGEIAAVIKGHAGVGDAYILPQFRDGHIESLTGFFTPHPHHAGMVAKVLEGQGGAEAQADLLYLPNGLPLFYKNKAETAAIYKEIFEEHLYHRHLDSLCAGDVVLDVGANIGLFSLYIGLHHPGVRVYAFEPIAAIHDTLGKNISLYGLGTVALNIGLGESEQEVAFTYYPHNTALSGRYGDDAKDKALARAAMLHQPESAALGEEALESLLDERIRPERVVCRVRRLSSVLRDQGIGEIALLKVDAERSEWEVLQGLDEWDWQRIRQLVLEVHDEGGRLDEIRRMLELRGYALHLEQQEELGSSGLYTVYARRQQEPLASDGGGTYPTLPAYNMGTLWTSPQALAESVRGWCQSSLPAYMVPSSLHLIEGLPVTSHGKIDKDALQELGAGLEKARRKYRGAENSLQQRLVLIWEEILHKGPVGIGDNFFELGGHSLKATQAVSRIHKQLGVKIELGSIFSYPTIEKLAQIIKETGEDKLFEMIEKVPEQAYYDLSHSQKRLWVLNQFEEERISYNMPAAFWLEGLQRDAFEKAYYQIIERHEILRTVFVEVGGEPKQKILSYSVSHLQIIYKDWREKQDKLDAVESAVYEDAIQPFDLEKGPLIRVTLLQIEADKYMFLFTMHHIISDGWSITVFLNELLTLYKQYCLNEQPNLPPLRLQYKDYVAWQQSQLSGAKLTSLKAYWHAALEKPLPVLNMPADFIRPVIKTTNGKVCAVTLDASLTEKVNRFAQQHSTSLFITLLASVKVLLYKYTGQDDLIVGTTIAGRGHIDLENQIGFYVNILPLRSQLSGDDTFAEFLSRVKTATLSAYEHQAYPFDRLVEELNLPRDLSRSPLFDVMVTFQNTGAEKALDQIEGIKLGEYNAGFNSSKFDLTLTFEESTKGLKLIAEYNRGLFLPERIKRMLKHVETLLHTIVLEENTPLHALNYLSNDEQRQLLSWGEPTPVHVEEALTLDELIERQVQATPNRIAVEYIDKKTTYEELNSQANSVAKILKDVYGVKPDDRVAILLTRSADVIITILGILKCGAAYAPIDPELPAKRMDYILQNSHVSVVLYNQQNQMQKNHLPESKWIDISSLMAEGMDLVKNPVAKIKRDSNQLAYVIYTSGSTGNPKGVMIPHSGVVNFMQSMKTAPGLSSNDRLLSLTTYSFDISVLEMFLPLSVGATVIMTDGETIKEPTKLIACIDKTKPTVMQATPSLWRMLLESGWNGDSKLKILCGGEAMTIGLAGQLLANCGQLWNMYGPTETTIWSLIKKIETPDAAVSIGRPIDNTQVYILDDHLQLVPPGIPGQLCIGGAGVSQGYLGNAELTEQKFVPSTWNPNILIYCTGDQASWLETGEIKFIGRVDYQVKISGYRIELGEVEYALAQHPMVAETIVDTYESTMGKELVAYVVLGDVSATTEQLRNFLMERLPAYMIPHHFSFLEKFPLTPNGKVDRKALQLNPINSSTSPYAAPQTRTEQKLEEAWKRILNKEVIGVEDNFFELGGHSLKATQLVSWIHKHLGVKLQLKDIFRTLKIRTLADLIDRSQRHTFEKIVLVPEQEHYELSNAQKRLWFLDQFKESRAAYNMPGAYTLRGMFLLEAFEKSIRNVVERHESLRTTFIAVDGHPRQRIHSASSFAIPMDCVDLRNETEPEKKAKIFADEEAILPFDLEKGPLFRIRILLVTDDHCVVLFTLHHIISDGWSMGILIKEILYLYGAYANNLHPILPALQIQYKDFAAWQNEKLATLEDEAYWLKKLSEPIQRLQLPYDYTTQKFSFHGGRKSFDISATTLVRLNEIAIEHNTSLSNVVFTVLNILLYNITGQEDIVVGVAIANRSHANLENIIGLFVNSLVIRNTISKDVDFGVLLGQVSDTMLEAFDHQNYPFDLLVEKISPNRTNNYQPIFNVFYGFQNFSDVEVEGTEKKSPLVADDVAMQWFDQEFGISKFDLTLFVQQLNGNLKLTIEYNRDLFAEATIDKYLFYFDKIVSAVTEAEKIAGE